MVFGVVTGLVAGLVAAGRVLYFLGAAGFEVLGGAVGNLLLPSFCFVGSYSAAKSFFGTEVSVFVPGAEGFVDGKLVFAVLLGYLSLVVPLPGD